VKSTLDIALAALNKYPRLHLFPVEFGNKGQPLDYLNRASNDPVRIREWHSYWPRCPVPCLGGTMTMRRRQFIKIVGGTAVAWPLAAGTKPRSAWRIGMLEPGASSPSDPFVDAFRDGLRGLGYREGRDILLEIRWAGGSNEPLVGLAVELVALKVDVLVVVSTPAALAAKQATATIPIVFTAVGDPVGAGVVTSLARPGGNATGFSMLATELSAKRLEILREIAPNTSPVAMLWNDTNPGMTLRAHESERAAATLGLTIQSYGVHDLVTFDPAFKQS
jgi:putative ABC transport system substrate-binding protein